MQIAGIQKLTLIDFPGRLAAAVFLCGCNFRCPWCYSRELVLPKETKKQPAISEKELFIFLKERKGLLEGVVICGGEPTTHKELPTFCKKIKNLGYLIKLDTNGSNPEMLKKLVKKRLIDYVAMDIKAPKEKYGEVVGMLECWNDEMFRNIEKSIEFLKEEKVDYEFRTTVVPTIHAKENVVQIAREISPAKRYYLQNFRPEKTVDPKFEKIKPYPKEYLLEIQKAVALFFEACEIR